MKGDRFVSVSLKLEIGSAFGRVHEVYADSIKVIYQPATPAEYAAALHRLKIGDSVVGFWQSAPDARAMQIIAAPCRWAAGEIYLHLKF